MEELREEQVSMPRIGDKAPEFTAKTTQGVINYPSDYKGSWTILFSHPAVSPRTKAKSRKRLVVRASFDDGKTWPYARALYHDVAAYSCLCETTDGSIGILYEKDREPFGDRHRNARIVFQTFSLEWLMGGSR